MRIHMSEIRCENISKIYEGNIQAIQDFNLPIKEGELLVIIGPSGSGKSTLLRMIAGLEKITSGTLYINGLNVNDVPTEKRNIAMVFQTYALFPHLSVYENIAIGLQQKKLSRDEIDKRVKETTDVLNISDLLTRKPNTLSGGQQQRVSIGRAIVRHSDIILMDEPLTNLDTALRYKMRQELMQLHKRLPSTIIYVTHDESEAMSLADRIVVLHEGKIQQVGTPYELYHQPANMFVARFLGFPHMNFCKAMIQNECLCIHGERIPLCQDQLDKLLNINEVMVGIRPEHIRIIEEQKGPIFHLHMIEQVGAESILHGNVNEEEVCIKLPQWITMDRLSFSITYSNILLFDAQTEAYIMGIVL